MEVFLVVGYIFCTWYIPVIESVNYFIPYNCAWSLFSIDTDYPYASQHETWTHCGFNIGPPSNMKPASGQRLLSSTFYLIELYIGSLSLCHTFDDADTDRPIAWRQHLFAVLIWQAAILAKQNICITFIQRWTNVEDVGPTLYKCFTNVSCLLGHCLNWSFLWTWLLCQMPLSRLDPLYFDFQHRK